MCLPDVSVYEPLCGIPGISINEFIAGEDIPEEKAVRKSEENIIDVTADGSSRQKKLRRVIALLAILCIIAGCILGRMLWNSMHRPKDYIVPLDSESTQVKTSEMVTGEDVMLFCYDTTAGYTKMNFYVTVYEKGEMTEKTLLSALDLNQDHSEGEIAVIPSSLNDSVRVVIADNASDLSFDYPVMEGEKDREFYGRTASQISGIEEITGKEQGLAAVEYGDSEVGQTPIGDLEEGNPGDENLFIYYFSFEFAE